MCAAFTPGYRGKKDARRAPYSPRAYTLTSTAAESAAVLVNVFASVLPAGVAGDIALLIAIGVLLMGVNASMADGSRARYEAAVDRLAPRQFEKLNRHQVPANVNLESLSKA